MPDDPAGPVVTAASFFVCWRAMGEAVARHSLRPLTFEGLKMMQNPGVSAPREGFSMLDKAQNALICHCPRKRAIQYPRGASA
jgi:hypothetical protein